MSPQERALAQESVEDAQAERFAEEHLSPGPRSSADADDPPSD